MVRYCTKIQDSRLLSYILNSLLLKYGDGVYSVVQKACPNLTCCADCHTDDFTHIEGCEIHEESLHSQEEKTPLPSLNKVKMREALHKAGMSEKDFREIQEGK